MAASFPPASLAFSSHTSNASDALRPHMLAAPNPHTTTTATTPAGPPRLFATGIAPLDALLDGGFAPSAVTVLTGASVASVLASTIQRQLQHRTRIFVLDTTGALTALLLHADATTPHARANRLVLRNLHVADLASAISALHPPAVLVIHDDNDYSGTTVARLRAAKAAHALACVHGSAVLVAAPSAGAGHASWTAVAETTVVITRDGMGVVEAEVVKGGERVGERTEWSVQVKGGEVEKVAREGEETRMRGSRTSGWMDCLWMRCWKKVG